MRHFFFKKKENTIPVSKLKNCPNGFIPKHIALVMDGNGRWAKNRGLPRIAGHKKGMETIKKIVKYSSKLKIKVLTLYAFSTENWKRPPSEVDFLMKLPIDFFSSFLSEIMNENIKIHVMGHRNNLPIATQNVIKKATEKTKFNTGMILNFALNYGSRNDILSAIKKIWIEGTNKKIFVEEITEKKLDKYLMTGFLSPDLRDPDLLIRTGGEKRLSNFLLWQAAYSELFFTKVFWPDFDELLFQKAIFSFQNRNRRLGGL